jgi:hypothetical protein
MKQPTHKTTHLQAPTHMPILQLAKELFFCHRTEKKLTPRHRLAALDNTFVKTRKAEIFFE